MKLGPLKFRGDAYIWFAIITLSLVGLLAVYSATGGLAFQKQGGNTEYFLLKHGLFLFSGFFLMYICHLLNYRMFSRLSQLFLWIAIPLLVLTLVFGNDINEAKRTLTIPFLGLSFQTSDFAKLALIMYIARYLSKNQIELNSIKAFGKIIAIICVVTILIMPENLSTSLVLFATSCLMLFIGNARLKHLFLLGGTFLLISVLGTTYLLKAPDSMLPGRALTWKSRIEAFSNENKSEQFQTQQAKIAIATGGLFGKGPGNGEQSAYLPYPYSDFIYSVIIEEYGLIIGGLLIILCYIVILFRSIRIVIKSPKAFGALLAVGLAFSLVIQAFIHMGVATSVLPVTGLTLPLVSMGGTSLIFNSLAFGIILSVSRAVEEGTDEPVFQPVVQTEGGQFE